jgi:hypothetical protein
LQERLTAITADDILRWMNLKAFGSPNPGPDAINPTRCRSSTILFWERAISFYMPNKHHLWDSLNERCNPTRSRDILLDHIKYVKKKEVWRQGVASQAWRPLTLVEFRSAVNALETGGVGVEGPIVKYGVPAQIVFQFHLIDRIDCACQF